MTLEVGGQLTNGETATLPVSEALQLRWNAIGIEYDNDVAGATADRTGADVYSMSERGRVPSESIDVLHLGDVIEHLTDLAEQMPSILRLLKPGGILLAQGPLEANANLFTSTVRLTRSIRKSRWTEMAPYHVILATASGQRRFFQRFGLKESEYIVREVAWPAPSVLHTADVVRPRVAALFLLRRVSQWSSAMRPGQWGNRYFYAGLKPA